MSTPDPTLGITCISTIFGLNYDGSPDPGDNGIGAFENPATGHFYRTANESIVGVSIPIPFYELTPDLSRSDVENKVVTVTILDEKGFYYEGLEIVDLGPGKNGHLIRGDDGPRLLDRTWRLCWMMHENGNPMDNVELTYWILKNGTPYAVKGQNTPYIHI